MTRTLSIFITCTIAITIALAGCGAEQEETKADPMEAADFSTTLATLACDKIFDCCPDGVGILQNAATCQTLVGLMISNGITTAINADQLDYNSQNAGDCAVHLETSLPSIACADFSADSYDPFHNSDHGSAACLAVAVGKVQAGDSCAAGDSQNAFACATGLTCGSDNTCVAIAEAGSACEHKDECIDGTYCDASDTCAAPLADGETCTDDEQCQSDTCDTGTCAATNMCE